MSSPQFSIDEFRDLVSAALQLDRDQPSLSFSPQSFSPASATRGSASSTAMKFFRSAHAKASALVKKDSEEQPRSFLPIADRRPSMSLTSLPLDTQSALRLPWTRRSRDERESPTAHTRSFLPGRPKSRAKKYPHAFNYPLSSEAGLPSFFDDSGYGSMDKRNASSPRPRLKSIFSTKSLPPTPPPSCSELPPSPKDTADRRNSRSCDSSSLFFNPDAYIHQSRTISSPYPSPTSPAPSYPLPPLPCVHSHPPTISLPKALRPKQPQCRLRAHKSTQALSSHRSSEKLEITTDSGHGSVDSDEILSWRGPAPRPEDGLLVPGERHTTRSIGSSVSSTSAALAHSQGLPSTKSIRQRLGLGPVLRIRISRPSLRADDGDAGNELQDRNSASSPTPTPTTPTPTTASGTREYATSEDDKDGSLALGRVLTPEYDPFAGPALGTPVRDRNNCNYSLEHSNSRTSLPSSLVHALATIPTVLKDPPSKCFSNEKLEETLRQPGEGSLHSAFPPSVVASEEASLPQHTISRAKFSSSKDSSLPDKQIHTGDDDTSTPSNSPPLSHSNSRPHSPFPLLPKRQIRGRIRSASVGARSPTQSLRSFSDVIARDGQHRDGTSRDVLVGRQSNFGDNWDDTGARNIVSPTAWFLDGDSDSDNDSVARDGSSRDKPVTGHLCGSTASGGLGLVFDDFPQDDMSHVRNHSGSTCGQTEYHSMEGGDDHASSHRSIVLPKQPDLEAIEGWPQPPVSTIIRNEMGSTIIYDTRRNAKSVPPSAFLQDKRVPHSIRFPSLKPSLPDLRNALPRSPSSAKTSTRFPVTINQNHAIAQKYDLRSHSTASIATTTKSVYYTPRTSTSTSSASESSYALSLSLTDSSSVARYISPPSSPAMPRPRSSPKERPLPVRVLLGQQEIAHSALPSVVVLGAPDETFRITANGWDALMSFCAEHSRVRICMAPGCEKGRGKDGKGDEKWGQRLSIEIAEAACPSLPTSPTASPLRKGTYASLSSIDRTSLVRMTLSLTQPGGQPRSTIARKETRPFQPLLTCRVPLPTTISMIATCCQKNSHRIHFKSRS
ncbi:hypothetical protein BD410DRAFT_250736 [Rickenella mellea]|uniref:Uncharacterized protein n=1 Tax=Rickenella mellea TaxID=50990 RepID=A0A4Y7QP82_9AGAM|nr:hypothetical protein BD410DRAFT_250736 [Rickenella mellea]